MIDIIKKRRSCRKFNNKEIPREILDDIMTAGTYAPSASNSQNIKYLLITDKKEIERIGKIKAPFKLVGSASALIIVFCDITKHENICSLEYNLWKEVWLQNSGASIQNMLLEATHNKVGSCWVSWTQKMDGSRLVSNGWWHIIFEKIIRNNYLYNIHGMVALGYTDHVDSDGYPLGDKTHGGKLVERPPLKEFMI